LWRSGFYTASGTRRQMPIELNGDAAELQRQVAWHHGMALAREPRHHILSQRTPGQQCRLHRDCVPHIRGVGGRIDEYRLPVGVCRFGACYFDGQRP
jgi:hypothetical protein